MVTNTQLNELIYYYQISHDFLNQISDESTQNATNEDLKKLEDTKQLFLNTLTALNYLKELLSSNENKNQ